MEIQHAYYIQKNIDKKAIQFELWLFFSQCLGGKKWHLSKCLTLTFPAAYTPQRPNETKKIHEKISAKKKKKNSPWEAVA